MAEQFRDTITIKFDAKGDQVLVKTIKKLDEATKSLIKAQSKLAGEGQKQVQTQNKNKSAIDKVNVSLALQGSNWKKAGISAKLYTQAVKGNKLALAQVQVATKKHIEILKRHKKGLLDTAHSTRILGGSFAVLRSKLLIASFAMMLVERTVVRLVKSFAKQEAVNQKLRAGLANIADTTEGVTQRLIDYSSALQQTTAFGDELITNGMTQLTTFGLNEEAIKSLTPQVLNVARAIQTTSGQMPDLNSLFIAFGKSTSTAVSALTRYGVVLTDAEKAQLESMGANERATAIAKILDKQYGGLAEAYAQTTMGMLEGAEAARGDAAEAFGEVLAPAVLAVSKALKSMAEALTPEHIKAYGTGFSVAAVGAGLLAVKIRDVRKAMQALQALAVKNWAAALVAVLGIATGAALDYFDVFEDGNDTLTDAEKRLKELKKSLEADKKAREELIKAQKEGADALQKELDLLNATSEVVKMHINLGHEASELETLLILKIVQKNHALATEKMARETSLKTYKKYLEAMKDEINLRITMSEKIELRHLDLLKEKFKSQLIDGKITESNSEKLAHYIDFNKELISTFGLGIHSIQKITDAGLENGIVLDMQSMNVENLTDKEKDYLQALIKIFNQQQKNAKQVPESYKKWVKVLEQKAAANKLESDWIQRLIEDDEDLARALGFVKDKEIELTDAQKDAQSALSGTLIAKRINLEATLKQLQADKIGAENANMYAEAIKNITKELEELGKVREVSIPIREQILGTLTEEQLREQELTKIQLERMQVMQSAIMNTTSAFKANFDQRMRNEIDALKQTTEYKKADAERRQDMEDKVARKYAQRQKAIFLIEKASKLADVYFNTASAIMKATALMQPWMIPVIKALGGVQAAAILATPAPQAFAKGGEFVTDKPEMIMVGEAGREHVKITPIDRPEERALGGGDIILNISAPLVDETVVESIIPAIEKAQRLNLA